LRFSVPLLAFELLHALTTKPGFTLEQYFTQFQQLTLQPGLIFHRCEVMCLNQVLPLFHLNHHRVHLQQRVEYEHF